MKKVPLLIFLVLSFLFPKNIAAYSCKALPDYWYISQIKFDEHSLPAGVSIASGDSAVEPSWIKNTSSTPLYLVGPRSRENYSFENSEIPDQWKPISKLVNGKRYYYYFVSGYGDKEGGWFLYEGYNQANVLDWLVNNRIEIDITSEDDRPENVEVPEPHDFVVPAIYGQKQISLTGEISYVLNKNYDPKAGAKGDRSCARGSFLWTYGHFAYIPVVGGVALIGGVVLVKKIRNLKKR